MASLAGRGVAAFSLYFDTHLPVSLRTDANVRPLARAFSSISTHASAADAGARACCADASSAARSKASTSGAIGIAGGAQRATIGSPDGSELALALVLAFLYKKNALRHNST